MFTPAYTCVVPWQRGCAVRPAWVTFGRFLWAAPPISIPEVPSHFQQLPQDQQRIPASTYPISQTETPKELDGRLGRTTNPYVRMSLRLQAAFGLRREESIKFQPRYADHGDHIAIKGSWATGGR